MVPVGSGVCGQGKRVGVRHSRAGRLPCPVLREQSGMVPTRAVNEVESTADRRVGKHPALLMKRAECGP